MKNQIQNGERLTWTNDTGSAVVSGQVVAVGALLGIATTDIAAAAVGTLALCGVFECPKTAHATAQAVAQGEKISWDASAATFANAASVLATGDISGNIVAFEAAASTAATVRVKFCGTPGTVT